MPSFLRRWVAREGHEAALRQGLMRVHETHISQNPHVMEWMVYREQFVGAEFVGLAIYDDEGALTTEARRQTLAALDEIGAAHATFSTPSLRCDVISEYLAVPHTGAYGIAGLITGHPERATEVSLLLKELAAELVDRFHPTRMLVVQLHDTSSTFFVLGDASERIDVDRYLQSSFYARHQARLAPLAAVATRWFSIDPVWRYFRLAAAPIRRAEGPDEGNER